jgi:transporter family protein
MLYVFFALASSILFGITKILDKKGLERADFLVGMFYTLGVQPPILLSFSILTGDLFNPHNYDLIVFFNLGFSGIFGFVFGLICLFRSIQIIGATRANIISTTQILFASILSVIILRENISLDIVTGISLVFLGLVVVSLSNPRVEGKEIINVKKFKTGYLLGLFGGFLWGASLITMKEGVSRLGSSIMANFLSSLFAILAVILILIFSHRRKLKLDKMSSTAFSSGGLLKVVGSLSRYVALGLAPVVLIAPLLSISPLVTLIISYLVIQKTELINKRALIGALLVVSGASLVTM